jgi:hypothetical protein
VKGDVGEADYFTRMSSTRYNELGRGKGKLSNFETNLNRQYSDTFSFPISLESTESVCHLIFHYSPSFSSLNRVRKITEDVRLECSNEEKLRKGLFISRRRRESQWRQFTFTTLFTLPEKERKREY